MFSATQKAKKSQREISKNLTTETAGRGRSKLTQSEGRRERRKRPTKARKSFCRGLDQR